MKIEKKTIENDEPFLRQISKKTYLIDESAFRPHKGGVEHG